MLVDWNEGYINACLQPDIIPVEDNNNYIPTSTWGYITGDISVQSDLMALLTNIESGLTTDQIALLVNVDSRLDEIEEDVADLVNKFDIDTTDIVAALALKADADSVYTKSEIDSRNYLTEHQDLSGYATENWVYTRGYISAETDPVWSSEKHKYALKSELPNTTGLASESWVKQQGYLTKHQSLANYYTKNEVDMAINNLDVDLSGYATEVWVSEQLLGKANAKDVYTKIEIDSKKYITEDILDEELIAKANAVDVYTKAEIDGKKYMSQDWAAEQLVSKANAVDVWTKVEMAAGKLNKDNVKLIGYLTDDALVNYATMKWVDENLTDYYTKSEVDTTLVNYATIELLDESLTNYYTKEDVDTAISNVEVDLTDYYTKSEIDAALGNVDVNLTGYATESWVTEQGYATVSYVDTGLDTKVDYSKIWSGTQEEWNLLTLEEQNSYIIAMIEL